MPMPWPNPCPVTTQETLAWALDAASRKMSRVRSLSRMTGEQIRHGRVAASSSLGDQNQEPGDREEKEVSGMATQQAQAVDHKLLVAGEWLETGEWDEVQSPYDGTPVGRVAQGDAALVDRAAKAAHE